MICPTCTVSLLELALLCPCLLETGTCCPCVNDDIYFRGCFPSPVLTKFFIPLRDLDDDLDKGVFNPEDYTDLRQKVFSVPFPGHLSVDSVALVY